jgi:hypothetical protein
MMSFTPLDNSIPFIVTTPARQSVEEQRQLIRSHVMRGKNRKKPHLAGPSWINGDGLNDSHTLTRQDENVPAISIPAKVGGEFFFPACPVEMCPATLESIWRRKPNALHDRH